MNYFKFLFIGLFLIHSCYGYSQWVELNSIPQQTIQVLSFLDDNLGYALMKNESSSSYTLEKTSDGGESWTSIDLPVPDVEFQDIHFYAEGQGVMLIRNLDNVMAPTRIYQTLDDGVTWQDISPDMTATGFGNGQCQFLSQDVGFFATDRSLYMTQDGGTQWTVTEFTNYILALDFLDIEHGTLGTWDGTFAYKGGMLSTSDGGVNWTETLLNENYSSIGKVQRLSNNLSFAAAVQGWAAIQADQFHKTTDGGSTWNSIVIPEPFDDSTLKQVHFRDEMNGVICVGNFTTTLIYHTSNGGATWEEEGTFSSIYEADMQLTTYSGYITGDEGIFYRLTDSTPTKELLTSIEVDLFPSPVQSGHAINWTSAETFSDLVVMNRDGKMIYQQAVDQSNAVLPNLNTGLYLIRLSNEEREVIKKLYVE
jgi:photosystem II stability/assembly factor-like uncharacterized protein